MLSLILPAFNEARRLPASLATCVEFFKARGLDAEIIVADDGSTDATPKIFADAVTSLPRAHIQYRLLQLPHRGKGAAVRDGVAAAQGDPIVFLDADLTIPVDILDQFIRALNEGADIAVASRYVKGSVVKRPWWRRVMGTVFRGCVHALVPVDVKDTQCGGKAYTAEAAKDLFRRSRLSGFSFDAEVLFIARRAGYRVQEIPFTLVQDRVTSIDFVAQTPRMLRDLVLIRFNAMRGRYR
ncbi:MAG TPA: glycosyltransferase [Candidatus Limnocylindrales bacterium]|nr:glycosyltransferase [Candidatus Limnocylindrales bacterium]